MIGRVVTVDMHPVCIAENERLTAEVLELLDEIKHLDRVNSELEMRVAQLTFENAKLKDHLCPASSELAAMRSTLRLWEVARTTGGPDRGYTDRWANKFAGQPPPAHPFTDKDVS